MLDAFGPITTPASSRDLRRVSRQRGDQAQQGLGQAEPFFAGLLGRPRSYLTPGPA
jgi:hypothetical protein